MIYQLLTLCVFIAAAAARPEGRIVNGWEAKPNSWGHQVSLQYRSQNKAFKHVCGASLISTDWAITAAHCVDFGRAANFRVVLGEHDLTKNEGTEQTIGISRIIKHPQYSGSASGFPNDIALLRLSNEATLNSYVSLISLPEANQDFTRHDCFITGWGKLSGAASGISSRLQEVDMEVITNTDCRLRWLTANIFNSHICIYEPNKSACNGDSGGPLVCQTSSGGWTLAGATSWGINSCSGAYPSVYTRISSYVSWIRRQTALA